MTSKAFINELQSLIEKNQVEEVMQKLKAILENSPQLNEVILQSSRYDEVLNLIRIGKVDYDAATRTKNQVKLGLLELIKEIEIKKEQPEISKELEKAIAIEGNKNVVIDSTTTEGGDIHIGDKEVHHHYTQNEGIPKYLTTPPTFPDVFIGRKEDLEQIHNKLTVGNNILLLVNGEGGIGKTTIAARYFHEYANEYKHLAWIFAESGILEGILNLSISLKIQFPEQMRNEERVAILLQKMAALDKPCLLIIDNANDIKDLEDNYSKLRTCRNFHLLLTSRINEYETASVYKVSPLEDQFAKNLFEKHYPKHNPLEDTLLKKLLNAVGKNTLVIELLAKSLRFKNRLEVSYALEELFKDLKAKGLFYVNGNRQIRTEWQEWHKNSEKPEKPEKVIDALYDLDLLSEDELKVLNNLSVLPAEFLPYKLLKKVVTEFSNLDKILIDLFQKGWIDFNEEEGTIKISPVVQEVVNHKTDHLFDCNRELLDNIIEKLDYEGAGHLINTDYTEGRQWVDWGEFLSNKLNSKEYSIGILFDRMASFYNTTGNLDTALKFFDQDLQLTKELYESYPENVSFKNGLAISYEKLGSTHSSLGNLDTALKFFEDRSQLGKELYESYPENVSFKNGLAISYEKLGSTHSSLGNLDTALKFFEDRSQLGKELYESYPENVSFKNGLAISYFKLGQIFDKQGDKLKCCEHYNRAKQVWDELVDEAPQYVEFKRSLEFIEVEIEESCE